MMKPNIEAVKVVGNEETETETVVSVSNVLSEVIMVLLTEPFYLDYNYGILYSEIAANT